MVVYYTAICMMVSGLLSTGEWKYWSYKYSFLVVALKCFDCAQCPENPKEGEVPVKQNCKTCLTSRTYSGGKLRALSITCSPVCPPTKGVDAGALVKVKVKCCYRDLCTGHAVPRIPSSTITSICLIVIHLCFAANK
ncbi:hypothetical protein CLF_100304 [Clonorchis sinensis]|uniref:UPAR/Ly6 domain-containing protein n=1 Tax=Clonorchis sinensis TaxID=79923 RepID=G7Y355_CLOSI|nr:hypothetical protein CLF_100304 [Clonorchis sinensis]